MPNQRQQAMIAGFDVNMTEDQIAAKFSADSGPILESLVVDGYVERMVTKIVGAAPHHRMPDPVLVSYRLTDEGIKARRT